VNSSPVLYAGGAQSKQWPRGTNAARAYSCFLPRHMCSSSHVISRIVPREFGRGPLRKLRYTHPTTDLTRLLQ